MYGYLVPGYGEAGVSSGEMPSATTGMVGVMLSDGSTVVAGPSAWVYGPDNQLYVGLVEKFTPSGALDTSFGISGALRSSEGTPAAMIADGDGILVGVQFDGSSVWRFTADGTPDAGFGVNGRVDLKSWIGVIHDMVKLPDGKTLVVGLRLSYDLGNGLMRLLPSGEPDTSFGTGGFVAIPDGLNSAHHLNWVNDATVTPAGKILVTGYYSNVRPAEQISVGFNADGSLDTSFGVSGYLRLGVGSNSDYGYDISVVGTSTFVLGYTAGSGTSSAMVAKLTAAGILDISYGAGGLALATPDNLSFRVSDGTMLPDGRAVLAGISGGQWFLCMISTNGILDKSFGTAGFLQLPGALTIENLLIAGPNQLIAVGSNGDFAQWKVDVNPASTHTAQFDGSLADYSVTKTAGTAVVDLKSTSAPPAAVTDYDRLVFSDYSVNLEVGATARMLGNGVSKTIVELYTAFFNRVPDADGLNFWFLQASAGMHVGAIADAFYQAGLAHSALTGYSASMGNADFVNVVYSNVLGRSDGADAEGLAFWTQGLDSGAETRGTLVTSILASAHTFKGNAEFGWVADLLDNKYAVGKLFGIDMGLSFNSAEKSIAEGMRIADAVTPTGTAEAIALIGVNPADIQLG